MSESNLPDTAQIIYLVSHYLNGTISFAELQELDTWKQKSKENKDLFESLISKRSKAAIKKMEGYHTEQKLDKILVDINQKQFGHNPLKKQQNKRWYAISVAAALLVLIGALLFINNKQTGYPKQYADVLPGSNKAILKLSDGRVIALNEQKNGTVVKQAGINIIKTSDGQLVYQVEDTQNNKPGVYNTITTPNGGQYKVRLPDGSEVWLNAASSLTYESSINKGAERRVKLSGEAYFQVAHDSKQPFIVQTATQEVKVLGTHFNVNSYANEHSPKTTLLEGRVEVSIPGTSLTTILMPQEQSIYRDGQLNKQRVDAELAIAWKNGKLKFSSADITQIMRQVARWYDIDILYKGAIPTDTFTGAINRQSNLATVLKMFEASQIRFRLEEIKGRKTLIIQP